MSYVKLGHFLLLTPQLRELERKFSDLVIVVPDQLLELFTEQKIFNRPLSQSQASKAIHHQKYINVLDLTYPLLQDIAVPDYHARLPRDSFLKPQHITKSYREALNCIFQNALDENIAEKKPFLDIEIDPQVLQRHHLERFQYFTVHTGITKSEKNWDMENFESSILQILEKNSHLKCVNIVGPGNLQLFDGKPLPNGLVTIHTRLREVAHILAGSLFHLDNDTALHHLAGALDVPSITIFGPTPPGTWSSLAQNHYIFWGGLSCEQHCNGAFSKECSSRICLNSINPTQVAQSACDILDCYAHL